MGGRWSLKSLHAQVDAGCIGVLVSPRVFADCGASPGGAPRPGRSGLSSVGLVGATLVAMGCRAGCRPFPSHRDAQVWKQARGHSVGRPGPGSRGSWFDEQSSMWHLWGWDLGR